MRHALARALQAQSVRTAGFAERPAAAGTLNVAARTNNAARSEVGVKFDAATNLFGWQMQGFYKFGWGHYFTRDASVAANIIGLAGSNFIVTGARPAPDALLVSSGFDMNLTPNVTVGTKFDSEFSRASPAFSGTARLRVAF